MFSRTPATELFTRLAVHARIHRKLDQLESAIAQERDENLLRQAVDTASIKSTITSIRF
jgi:hypothetical protein